MLRQVRSALHPALQVAVAVCLPALLAMLVLALPAPAAWKHTPGPVLSLSGGKVLALTVHTNHRIFDVLQTGFVPSVVHPATTDGTLPTAFSSDQGFTKSQLLAWSAAAYLGEAGPRLAVLIESPAGPLLAGDAVLTVDDTPVTSVRQFKQALAVPSSHSVLVLRAGQRTVVSTAAGVHPEDTRLLLAPSDFSPPAGSFALDGFHGPSAGLAFALADLFDQYTLPFTVAATGRVDAAGRVYPVGQVQVKASLAGSTPAQVLFVPTGQEYQATGFSGPVVPVSSLAEARDWLCAAGALHPSCPSPGQWSPPSFEFVAS